MSDQVKDYTAWADRPFPDTEVKVFIQWKGTDVCIDFWCPCSEEGLHFDGYSAYVLKCPSCGTIYELGTQVAVRKTENPFKEPKMLNSDDGF